MLGLYMQLQSPARGIQIHLPGFVQREGRPREVSPTISGRRRIRHVRRGFRMGDDWRVGDDETAPNFLERVVEARAGCVAGKVCAEIGAVIGWCG